MRKKGLFYNPPVFCNITVTLINRYYYVILTEKKVFMEPAILISRLLLRTRRMYVASIRLDFH